MIDDDAEYEQRRQIRAQADADVSEFISSLGEDEGSGVPPPPSIKVSEVSSQPVEFDFLGFGPQRSGTAPAPMTPPPPPSPWACCKPDNSCEMLLSTACSDVGGTLHVGQTCDEVDCTPTPTGACCNDSDCSITTELDCSGDYQGDGSVCDPNPCSPVGHPCCLPTHGCILTDETTCDGASGRYFPDEITCDDVLCAICGECECFVAGPIEDGLGGFWTRVDIISGVTTYSGPTTADARFVTTETNLTDCVDSDGWDCIQTAFCNSEDPESIFCDIFTSPDCLTSPPTCNTSFQQVSGPVETPCA